MSSLNKVMLIGRAGQEPESKTVASGTIVTRMSIATSEKWKDASGEAQEKTEWHRVIAFGKLGEVCAQYVHKGSLIYVEGKLQTRSYEKDGVKRYTTEIIAEKVQFLGQKLENHAPTASNDDSDFPF